MLWNVQRSGELLAPPPHYYVHVVRGVVTARPRLYLYRNKFIRVVESEKL
jgi:hypothetical protein